MSYRHDYNLSVLSAQAYSDNPDGAVGYHSIATNAQLDGFYAVAFEWGGRMLI